MFRVVFSPGLRTSENEEVSYYDLTFKEAIKIFKKLIKAQLDKKTAVLKVTNDGLLANDHLRNKITLEIVL